MKIVQTFKQANLPFLEWDKATSEGVCVAISVHWLIKRAAGEDFWAWLKTVKGITSVLNTQATGESRFRVTSKIKAETPGAIPEKQTANRNSWIGYLTSEGGLIRDGFIKRNSDFTATAQGLFDRRKYVGIGAYCHIDLYGSIGGHTVAMDGTKSKPLFMDPNMGEIEFDSKEEFILWFPNFVRSYAHQDTASSPVKSFSSVEAWAFKKA